ncbi:Inositol-1-monophosphatase [hydrothermal vent metagenome]|uniref:inositol-phosphate phosphatase n=1 Tax=hydrothermal vent metagenome TaxID=652676 RepID=A0A3B1AYN0_9ZZZZ
MHPMLNIAIRAARKAGDVIARHADQIDKLTITEKSQNDFVSEVDQMAEQEIIHIIQKAYPDHSILAEESGLTAREEEYQWIIDPLDGTTNFLYGFPHFSVSIALRHNGRLTQAVVYDPMRQEMFSASRGGGAQFNSRRMRVSKRKDLNGALLGTGIPYKASQEGEMSDAYFEMMKALIPGSAGIRRAGSAALDLAYVAAGRLDGFWELDLNIWDIAAGVLLIEEAGGIVSGITGNPDHLQTGHVVAGNPRLFKSMLQTIKPHIPAALKP